MYEIYHFNQLPNPEKIQDYYVEIYGNLNDLVHIIYIPSNGTEHYYFDFKLIALEFSNGESMFNDIQSVSFYVDD